MPHQGIVAVKKPLDYEKSAVYHLNIKATVITQLLHKPQLRTLT